MGGGKLSGQLAAGLAQLTRETSARAPEPNAASDSVRFLHRYDREVCWLGGKGEPLQMCSLRRSKQQSVRETCYKGCCDTGDSNSGRGRSAYHPYFAQFQHTAGED